MTTETRKLIITRDKVISWLKEYGFEDITEDMIRGAMLVEEREAAAYYEEDLRKDRETPGWRQRRQQWIEQHDRERRQKYLDKINAELARLQENNNGDAPTAG